MSILIAGFSSSVSATFTSPSSTFCSSALTSFAGSATVFDSFFSSTTGLTSALLSSSPPSAVAKLSAFSACSYFFLFLFLAPMDGY
jgi:hypothetical protein